MTIKRPSLTVFAVQKLKSIRSRSSAAKLPFVCINEGGAKQAPASSVTNRGTRQMRRIKKKKKNYHILKEICLKRTQNIHTDAISPPF